MLDLLSEPSSLLPSGEESPSPVDTLWSRSLVKTLDSIIRRTELLCYSSPCSHVVMLNLHASAFPQNRESTRIKITNQKNPGRENQVRWCLAWGYHALSSLDGFLIAKAWNMFPPLFFIATARLSAVTFSLGYVHCYSTFYSVF